MGFFGWLTGEIESSDRVSEAAVTLLPSFRHLMMMMITSLRVVCDGDDDVLTIIGIGHYFEKATVLLDPK